MKSSNSNGFQGHLPCSSTKAQSTNRRGQNVQVAHVQSMAAGLDALQVLGTALGAEDDGIPGGLEDVDHIWIIYPKDCWNIQMEYVVQKMGIS